MQAVNLESAWKPWNLHLETLSSPTTTLSKQMLVLFTPHWVVLQKELSIDLTVIREVSQRIQAEQGRAGTAPVLQIYTFCKAFGIAHYSECNCSFSWPGFHAGFHGVRLFSRWHLCPSPNGLFSWFYGLGVGRTRFKFP